MAKVFQPDPQRLTDLGHARVADVPVIFDRTHRYLREHNRYLRDRALGNWSPNAAGEARQGERPAFRTVRTIAAHLAIFVDWCEDRELAWREVDYDDCLRFQNEMAEGRWSPSGTNLARSTANHRTDEVTSFLQWATRHGLRGDFEVPVRTGIRNFTSTSTTLPGRAMVRARVGRLKNAHSGLQGAKSILPTSQEVANWMNAVKARRGYAKYLACRFILETGVRLHEVVAILPNQIPTEDELDGLSMSGRTSAPVYLTVTKGDRPRTIQVSIEYLRLLREWIDGRRMKLTLTFSKRTRKLNEDAKAKGEAELKVKVPGNLFISDAKGHEGTAILEYTIRECFASVEPRPHTWYPHFGRHTYACLTVLEGLRNDAEAAGSRLDVMGADWINSQGEFLLRNLQSQLGHLSDETTKLYIRWLTTAVGIADVTIGWHKFLSDEKGAS